MEFVSDIIILVLTRISQINHLEPNRWSNCRANLLGTGTTPGLGLEHQIRFFHKRQLKYLILKVASTRVSHFQVSGTNSNCLSGSIISVIEG